MRRLWIAGALALGACGGGPGAPDGGDAGPVDLAAADRPVDAASAAPDLAELASGFSAPQTLSDPGAAGFAPSVAARDGGVLVAWHEFGDGGARIVYARVQDGVPEAPRQLTDPFAPALRPQVAPTAAGYLLAYQANDGTRDVARAVELDAAGTPTAGPETVSAAGASAAMVHAAAVGGEEAFAWTDGTTHFFALRGAIETAAAAPVGTTLQSQGLLNFPRIALDGAGTLFLAFRDGGSSSTDWDVLLSARPAHGAFAAPVDVSNSPGLLSDDIALALEPDGTLDLAWVDQDPVNVINFEVEHAARAPSGALSAPALFGAQSSMTWTPCLVEGSVAVWNGGGQGIGPLFIASPVSPPAPLLAPENGSMCALAREPSGALDLAWVDDATPRRIRFSRRP